MKNSTCIDSASPKAKKNYLNADKRKSNADIRRLNLRPSACNLRKSALLNKERMLKYKTFSVAFSYPDNGFFTFFPALLAEKESLIFEYDQLFRAGRVWLYAAEYTAENEFQRANSLSDIMGFYRAFGLEPDKERPDSLVGELEFMHCLIFKEMNAPDKEKSLLCMDAQKKFFKVHLYPAAKKIAEEIIQKSKSNFYVRVAQDMLEFLDCEKDILFNTDTHG